MKYLRINRRELLAALDQINLANRDGFTESLAVFLIPSRSLVGDEKPLSMQAAYFSDIWCRASRTDPSQDWGRNYEKPAYIDCRVVDGMLVPKIGGG